MKQAKTILIDVSLTGGRGPAKKTYEFVETCKEKKVNYKILTNRNFEFKLRDMGVRADYVIDVGFADQDETIQQKYYETLKDIDFDLLARFGARVPGPSTCLKLDKPYIIVDGGLPDKTETYPSLYDKEAFQKTKKYIITTQFPWDFPKRFGMENVEVGYYPISNKTKELIKRLQEMSRQELVSQVGNCLSEIGEVRNRLFINLVFTGDFLENIKDRKTYGGWLLTREYDQCMGWLRRLFIDLGELYKNKLFIFVDTELVLIVSDLLSKYRNIKILTFKNNWNYKLEIMLKALADINISRATNYQPYIALLTNGGSVTTPVPADGYMDEDTAGVQYADLGLTKLIEYDDENYVRKLLDFAQDKRAQEEISQRMKEVCWKFLKERNTADLVIEELNKL